MSAALILLFSSAGALALALYSAWLDEADHRPIAAFGGFLLLSVLLLAASAGAYLAQ